MRREAARSRRVSLTVVLTVAVFASGSAHAQWPPVPVEIAATEPGSTILVRGAGRELPCGERCVLYLPEHQYRVVIRDAEGHGSATALNILEPISLAVTPANYYEKVRGVGLFVGGLAAAVVGVVMLFVAQHNDVRYASGACPNCSETPSWQWYAGGAVMATGLAVGAMGMFVWRTNASARVQTRPFAAPPPPPAPAPPPPPLP